MTDNMRQALRLRNEKMRQKYEQQTEVQRQVGSAISKALATIGSIVVAAL